MSVEPENHHTLCARFALGVVRAFRSPTEKKDSATGCGPRCAGCDPVEARWPAGRGTASDAFVQRLAATEATESQERRADCA